MATVDPGVDDSRETTLTANGVGLCVQAFGDPAAPTILLVAGAACSMDWWDEGLCRRLAAGGRHVVRYDHRDTGRSTTSTPGQPSYGPQALERDCAELASALGGGPVHLVGFSMGGGIAQVLASRSPELVATLTLVATSPVGGVDADLPGPEPGVLAFFESPPPDPDWDDVDSYADWLVEVERSFAGEIAFDAARTHATAVRVHHRSLDPAGAANHWLVVGGGEERPEPHDVRGIAARTLVVHGTHDPLFPLPHGVALAAAIPGARLLQVPGMGHQVPPRQTWDLVVPAILAHTAETAGPSTSPRGWTASAPGRGVAPPTARHTQADPPTAPGLFLD